MAFLQIQTRTGTAAPLPGLPALMRAALARLMHRPQEAPEDLLAAQARREAARTAVDRLMR